MRREGRRDARREGKRDQVVGDQVFVWLLTCKTRSSCCSSYRKNLTGSWSGVAVGAERSCCLNKNTFTTFVLAVHSLSIRNNSNNTVEKGRASRGRSGIQHLCTTSHKCNRQGANKLISHRFCHLQTLTHFHRISSSDPFLILQHNPFVWISRWCRRSSSDNHSHSQLSFEFPKSSLILKMHPHST